MATTRISLLCSLSQKTRTFLAIYVAFALIFQDIVLSAGPGHEDDEEFVIDHGDEGSGGGPETTTAVNLHRIENTTFAVDDIGFVDERSSGTARVDPLNTTTQYPEIVNSTSAAENVTTRGPTDTIAKGGSIGGPEKNPYSIVASVTLTLLTVQYFMPCI